MTYTDLANLIAAMKDREVKTRWYALARMNPDEPIGSVSFEQMEQILLNEIQHRPSLRQTI